MTHELTNSDKNMPLRQKEGQQHHIATARRFACQFDGVAGVAVAVALVAGCRTAPHAAAGPAARFYKERARQKGVRTISGGCCRTPATSTARNTQHGWDVARAFFPGNLVAYNVVVLLLFISHSRAVFSDPGIVPLPAHPIDFSDEHQQGPVHQAQPT